MANRYNLFLSHNSADKSWAEHLATAIEADRSGPPLRAFFDKWDIPPGGDVPAELEAGLQGSEYVGLILSPESLGSPWVSLERSTAIYRDPGARRRALIPLLRRSCDVPDMLARLKYIDFTRDQDFDASLAELIRVLRGLPAPRGGTMSPDDVHFRQDAHLLSQHRQIFVRGGFEISCIIELFLSELSDAIDGTNTALNTGALLSRRGEHLATFEPASAYKTPAFKETFAAIKRDLSRLKRDVTQFAEYFRKKYPNYSHHENFYAMVISFAQYTTESLAVQKLVALMDDIDKTRNEILGRMNALLTQCGEATYALIDISSDIIRQGRIGGAQAIAKHLLTPAVDDA